MSKIVYEIVKHDGGWAYRANGTYSESFRSHDEAKAAASLAAQEQALPGEETKISWEDSNGRWHHEVSKGNDRPEIDVEG